ncbi:LSU ribosomal protein L13P [Picrophilus oshimae DSM 9789]|nr:LSU ribosomal protein L13P [Picrophilus oshimae DSM 9789]
MPMIYIDASNHIYGRLSSYVAKKLLNGESITIVNASKVVITGRKEFIIDKFNNLRNTGSIRKGPYYPKTADRILKRSIGDMLPKKKTHGMEALKRCMVYANVPKSLENKNFERIESAMNKKVTGFITLGEISKILGETYE